MSRSALRYVRDHHLRWAWLRKTQAFLAVVPLTACAGQHFTPGLTLKCDGHCRIVPANLDQTPDPAALRPTRRLP